MKYPQPVEATLHSEDSLFWSHLIMAKEPINFVTYRSIDNVQIAKLLKFCNISLFTMLTDDNRSSIIIYKQPIKTSSL